jgi:FkbM family methyltransferase
MYTPRIQGNPPLTRRLVEDGIFRNDPFSLVDVGASGGIDWYWDVFGDSLRAVGFDGLVKEVERLNAEASRQGRQYYAYLVGDKSYQSPEGIPNRQPFPRTSAARAVEITSTNYAAKYFDQTGECVYATEMIELDQFFLKDHAANVDFIKIDTDGSDYQVLRGARQLLAQSNVLGIGIEAQFHAGVHDETNTFRNIDRLLTGMGFSLFDLEVYRYSRAVLPSRFVYRIPAQTETGQVLWGEALYLRDAAEPHYEADWKTTLPAPKMMKLACLFELFGLPDCAAELLLRHRAALAGLLDIDACLDLLAPASSARKRASYSQYVAGFEKDPASFYPPK